MQQHHKKANNAIITIPYGRIDDVRRLDPQHIVTHEIGHAIGFGHEEGETVITPVAPFWAFRCPDTSIMFDAECDSWYRRKIGPLFLTLRSIDISLINEKY